jgi:heme-degrading monooxygenase HmoA
MVQETFLLEVQPGTEREFEHAFREATNILGPTKGYLGTELQRCIETENRYLVSIKWETVEDHMIGFKSSPAFEEMKALIGPYYFKPPIVEHYQKIDLE